MSPSQHGTSFEQSVEEVLSSARSAVKSAGAADAPRREAAPTPRAEKLRKLAALVASSEEPRLSMETLYEVKERLHGTR